MRHNTSKKIFNYWNNLRGARVAPDRTEIEPSDIRDMLGDTFILEVDQFYRTISFRLAGTRLCSAYGKELKSVGFLGLWDELDNLTIFDAVKQVYERSKPCTISYISQSAGNKFLEYEIVLLPLLNSTSETMRILGTAVPSETPNWIGVDPIVNNRIKTVRTIDLPERVTPPALAPSLPPSDVSAARRVAHLTVIEGGRDQ